MLHNANMKKKSVNMQFGARDMTVLQSFVRICCTGYVLALKGLHMSSTNIFYLTFLHVSGMKR